MDADRWERKRQRWERRWERRRARWNSPGRHLFSGAIFVLIGMVFLLGNMGFLNVDHVLRFWPVILIALGAFKIIECKDDLGHSSGIFWIVIGSFFLLGNLEILRVTMRDLWPVVLIGFGVLLLWRSSLARRPREIPPDPSEPLAPGVPGAPGPIPTSSNSTLSAMAILGGFERRNNSQDFRGGDVTVVLGGCNIDLRNASITTPHEPVLEVFALFGGIEIHVPPDWTVLSKVDPILGGYDDKTHPPKDDSKRLIIRGSVIMGGINVMN